MRSSGVTNSVATLLFCLAAGMAFGSGEVRAEQPVAAAMAGAPFLLHGNYDIAALGYELEEFAITGDARSFTLAGEAAANGQWQAEPAETSPYTTRIVVIRPIDPATFNGTVLVEWMNVSGGLDVPVEWTMMHREMMRSGYAYVAVSAQIVGIEGGPNLGRGTARPLKQINPARYAGLSHPGDGFAYDIFSDVARLLRSDDASALMGPLVPQRLIAMGESQSAFFLTTYVNAVDPLARAYDGFLIHSRSGPAAPIDGASMLHSAGELQTAVRLRADLRVPVMQVHTETDLIGLLGSVGFHAARQPDTERLRTWEIAGAAHADNYLFSVGSIDSGLIPLEQLAAAWAPMPVVPGMDLVEPMNNGPQHHYVAQAALHHLDQWVRSGVAPPSAEPLELVAGARPVPATDSNGNTIGGLRTPWVDVPTSRLSGVNSSTTPTLVGGVTPFDDATLARLYPGGMEDYMGKFSTALDRAIASGFLLASDRAEILALARLSFPGE